ncbi:MAG: hypothetical protein KKD31_11470, partial [Bacteroidetes bacterium]|nr:hypothetical protein [Bacteroidota bacterium]
MKGFFTLVLIFTGLTSLFSQEYPFAIKLYGATGNSFYAGAHQGGWDIFSKMNRGGGIEASYNAKKVSVSIGVEFLKKELSHQWFLSPTLHRDDYFYEYIFIPGFINFQIIRKPKFDLQIPVGIIPGKLLKIEKKSRLDGSINQGFQFLMIKNPLLVGTGVFARYKWN